MAGFERCIVGFGSNNSTNCATTTAPTLRCFIVRCILFLEIALFVMNKSNLFFRIHCYSVKVSIGENSPDVWNNSFA